MGLDPAQSSTLTPASAPVTVSYEDFVPTDDQIRSAAHRLVSNFTPKVDLDIMLAGVSAAAVTLIEEVDFADIMLIDADTFRSVGPTAPFLPDLDAVQMELQQGPCLAAAVADSVVRCPDLSQDVRWPAFSAEAVKVGVMSMLSFPVHTGAGGAAGALNMFGLEAVESFDPRTEALGAMLATHAAVAIIATAEHRQFQSALASRDLIGQAKGVLMERFTADAVRAFEMLTALSQDMNVPVRVLAARIVDTSAEGVGHSSPVAAHLGALEDCGLLTMTSPVSPQAGSALGASGP